MALRKDLGASSDLSRQGFSSAMAESEMRLAETAVLAAVPLLDSMLGFFHDGGRWFFFQLPM